VKERLKKKWGIKTELQFWTIMVIFSLAGSSTVWIRKPVFVLLGVGADTNFLLKFLLWLAVIFPAYQIMLMAWGTLLGQFQFVWWFEKKMLRRMGFFKGEAVTGPPGSLPEQAS
jgi:hypothetical protein